MNSRREIERVLETWFVDGPTVMPDRVFDAVFDRVERTPQRRLVRLQMRLTDMNPRIRLIAVAAAAVIVAVVGFSLIGRGPTPNIGATPSPPAAPTPSIGPTDAPSLPPMPLGGPIDPGTYLVTSYTETPFQVTVPAGWTVTSGMIATGDFFNERSAVLLRSWVVTHVYADACQWQGAKQPVGPSKAELVAALSAQTGRDVAGPFEATLGGLEATRFVFSVPGTFDASGCDDGYLRPWPDTGGGESVGPPMFTGSITEVYVVETNGKATAIQAAHYEGSPAGDIAELEAVLDSIVFVP